MLNDPPQDLPLHDNQMETTEMGDCVCVIVLWTPVAGTYQNVRGFHGGGGIDNVNVAGLMNGVPNAATTQIYVIAGPGNKSQFGKVTLNNWYLANVRTTHPNALIRFHHRIANAVVHRNGDVQVTSFEH
jgi:hypothetical protein